MFIIILHFFVFFCFWFVKRNRKQNLLVCLKMKSKKKLFFLNKKAQHQTFILFETVPVRFVCKLFYLKKRNKCSMAHI